MKPLILTLFFACSLAAQNIMPPTNAPLVMTPIPDVNPQPMGDWTNVILAWEPSPSPDIDHYNIYNSPTLKPWNGHLVGSTTNLTFTLYIGGTAEGFPGVSAVNKQALESKIKL